MSRSSPSAPLYLQGAIHKVEDVLALAYPEPMTAREVTDALREEGYAWPLRPSWENGYQYTSGEPTQARVRRVCEIAGGRTAISHAGKRGSATLYSIYGWGIERALERAERRAALAEATAISEAEGYR